MELFPYHHPEISNFGRLLLSCFQRVVMWTLISYTLRVQIMLITKVILCISPVKTLSNTMLLLDKII